MNKEYSVSKKKNKSKKTELEPKKRSKFATVLIIILASLMALLLILIVAAVIYIKANFKLNHNDITNKPDDLGFVEVIEDKNINIALFGIDTRNKNSFKGLSDSIMILSINTDTKNLKLISVMRDTLVPIEQNGKTTYAKINSAYSKGGPELAIKTLNTVFGLDISEYATVNFDGMAEIVDCVGGIDVQLTENELSHINSSISAQVEKYGGNKANYELSEAGKVHLNGVQAVAYSRIRYTSNAEGTSNDYGRTDRQRYVIKQLFNKAKTLNKDQYVGLVKLMLPCCETSLSYREIIDIAFKVMFNSPSLDETRIPSTDYTMKAPTTKAGSVVYYDLNFAAKLIHSFIYDDIKPEDYILANGIEKNDWYSTGFNPPVFEK